MNKNGTLCRYPDLATMGHLQRVFARQESRPGELACAPVHIPGERATLKQEEIFRRQAETSTVLDISVEVPACSSGFCIVFLPYLAWIRHFRMDSVCSIGRQQRTRASCTGLMVYPFKQTGLSRTP